MKTSELRNKTDKELKDELHELLKEQFNLRMQKGSGQLVRAHQVKEVRRGIARVKTIMREKVRAAS